MTREEARVWKNRVEDGTRFSEIGYEQILKILAGPADQGVRKVSEACK